MGHEVVERSVPLPCAFCFLLLISFSSAHRSRAIFVQEDFHTWAAGITSSRNESVPDYTIFRTDARLSSFYEKNNTF